VDGAGRIKKMLKLILGALVGVGNEPQGSSRRPDAFSYGLWA
jgi:hypothetical protein